MDTKPESYTQTDWLQGEDPPNEENPVKMPIIIGSLYQYQWSEIQWYLIAASVVEGEEYARLCSTPPYQLNTTHFRETWDGSLEEFKKHWYYCKERDIQARRYDRQQKEKEDERSKSASAVE